MGEDLRHIVRNKKINGNFEYVTLPQIPVVPGQIDDSEARYLYWLTKNGYAGIGEIVELGTWLGKSTLHLACGLRDSEIAQKKCIYSYDRFVWGGEQDNRKSGLSLTKGTDFYSKFLQYTNTCKDYIISEKLDFTDIRWESSKKIEILFFDGPKDKELLFKCFSIFNEALIPGKTILVFQDYQHPISYELAITLESLGDKIDLLHSIEAGGTVSFLLKERIDIEDDLLAIDIVNQPIIPLWETLIERHTGMVKQRMKAAYALYLCMIGDIIYSRKILDEVDFDNRLHAGWKSWQDIPKLKDIYGPIFDHYNKTIRQ